MKNRNRQFWKKKGLISLLGMLGGLLLLLSGVALVTSAEPHSTLAAHNVEVNEVDKEVKVLALENTPVEDVGTSTGDEQASEAIEPDEAEVFDEWIIKWQEGSEPPVSTEFIVLSVDRERQIMLVKLQPQIDVDEWYAEWSAKEEIEYIEPDHTLKISFRPNDSGVSQQQYLSQINAFEGWKIERENRNITIAILDTGVDLEHPDLKDNLVPGINLIDRTKPPQDDNGHGTQVAGVLGAKGNNNQGVAGILWSAKMMPVKVLDKEGEGTPFRVAQGIYQSIEKGASIVLLSLGDPVFSQTLLDAVVKAEEEGVLVIAATGNEGARVNYPAAFPTVFAVGAVDGRDRVVSYSNAGPEVNVVAAGTVYTTRLNGGYGANSGTSMAAPQVAGLAALIWKQNPTLLPSEVRNHIIYTSKDVHTAGWNPQTGHGRIDIGKALQTKPVNNIYSPNHVMSQAAPFPIDTMVRAELRNKEDLAWFEINAPYRGNIELRVSLDIAKTNGVDLTFYPGGQGEQSFLYNINKDKTLRLTVPKGKSYIRLKYNNHERRATPLKYTLQQSFTIYADSQQPNNTKGRATKLQGQGEVLTGTFHRSYLNHWYYFDAPQRGEIELNITVDTLRLDPVIYYERPDGKTITIDEGGVYNGQEEHLVTEVQPGRHYFRVSHYYGHKVNGEYYLRFHYKPLFEDKYEPNNSMSQAAKISTGQNISATISPRGDVDWFQSSVGKDRYLQVQLSNIPEQVGLEAKLYNQKGVLIASHKQGARERGFLFGDKVDPGTYYVAISADREFPFDSYTLRLNDLELLFGFRDISGHWAVYEIVEATRQGLVQGVGDYRFAPNEGMNRAAVATLINRLSSFPDSRKLAQFKDVANSHWAAKAISNTVQQGIIQGFPDGTFKPERSITRAEVAIIFDRMMKDEHELNTQSTYTDLPKNHWAYTSIMRLSAEGLLSGYQDGSFKPNQPMTRAEFVTLVQRMNKR